MASDGELAAEVAAAETAASRPPSPATARQARLNRALLVVRRVHLYLGLALLPWALLYGVTAILFNHPTWFTGATTERVDRGGLTFPGADALAADLVAELGRVTTASLEVAPGSARLERELVWRLGDETTDVLVAWEPGAADAQLRTNRRAPRPEEPLEAGKLKTGRAALEAATAAVTSLARDRGLAPGNVRPFPPELELTLLVDGVPHRARLDLREGKLTCRPADRPAPLSWRSFFTRLHLTHGYPAEAGPRLGWALVVDLMGAALLVWGASGVLMWLPMRGLRRPGALALVAGAVAMGGLGWALHAAFTR